MSPLLFKQRTPPDGKAVIGGRLFITMTAGVLLLLASLAKGVEPAPVAAFGIELPAQLLAGAELVFGAYLVACAGSVLAARLGGALYFVFALQTATVLGNGSCGCFGQFSPPAWIMLVLDSSFSALLFVSSTRRSKAGEYRTVAVRLGVAGIAVTFLLLFALAPLSANGGAATRAVAKGHLWTQDDLAVGGQMPSIRFLNDMPALDKGTWAVLFARPTCGTCVVEELKYVNLARAIERAGGATRVAVVYLPSGDHSEQVLVTRDVPSPMHRAWLSGADDYDFNTPTGLLVEDGRITHLKLGLSRGELP